MGAEINLKPLRHFAKTSITFAVKLNRKEK